MVISILKMKKVWLWKLKYHVPGGTELEWTWARWQAPFPLCRCSSLNSPGISGKLWQNRIKGARQSWSSTVSCDLPLPPSPAEVAWDNVFSSVVHLVLCDYAKESRLHGPSSPPPQPCLIIPCCLLCHGRAHLLSRIQNTHTIAALKSTRKESRPSRVSLTHFRRA